MAISLYTGLPGHGKSYGVVENVIAPALKKGRKVFSNIPMKDEECISRFGMTTVKFDAKEISSNPNWWSEVFEKGSLFVLDEVAMVWPAGLKANNIRDSDKEFLSQHRHMVSAEGFSTEIILMVQKPSHIAAYVRGLVESTFWTNKLVALGMNNNYRIDVYSGCSIGDNPIVSKRQREIHGKFKKSIYDLYVSQTLSDSNENGDETRIDSRFNVLKGSGIKIGILFIIICIFGAYYMSKPVLENYGYSDKPKIEPTIKASTSQPLTKPLNKKPEVKLLSQIDSIMFTHSMTYTINGQKLTTNYFKLIKGKTEATVTDAQLKLLGYAFSVISDCVFLVEGSGFKDFVMCPKKDEDKNFFSDLTTSNT